MWRGVEIGGAAKKTCSGHWPAAIVSRAGGLGAAAGTGGR